MRLDTQWAASDPFKSQAQEANLVKRFGYLVATLLAGTVVADAERARWSITATTPTP